MKGYKKSRKMYRLGGIFLILVIAALGWTSMMDRPPENRQISKEGRNVHPHMAVDRNGDLHLAWIQILEGRKQVMFTRSPDGGLSFSDPVPVSPLEMDLDTGADGGVEIAVGQEGQVYLVWGGTMTDEPLLQPSSLDLPDQHVHNSRAALDIYFSRSVDHGKTFSPPQLLNDDSVPEDALYDPSRHRLPVIALGKNDEIHVAWIDKRKGNSLNPGLTDIYMTRSSDGGETFEPNVEVTSLQDESLCICCKPVISIGENDLIGVAFRNSLDDVKDMYAAFSYDGGRQFTEMVPVDHGGWQFNGCPMSGPGATAYFEKEYHVVWADGGAVGDIGHQSGMDLSVFYAKKDVDHSDFSARRLISESGNHPNIIATSKGEIFAVWEEYSESAPAVYLAALSSDTLRPFRINNERGQSGYLPILASNPEGSLLYLAWADHRQEDSQIYFAELSTANVKRGVALSWFE